jgi:glycosyltransferase involved in cell wall biosynthesis
MNLLQVDTEVRWGGGQQQVTHLCEGLARKGHRVTLVCHRDGILCQRVNNFAIRVFPLPSFGEIDPRGVFGLARIIRDGRFDLMHMHSSRAHTMGVMAGMLTRIRPRVVSRRSSHFSRRDPFNRWKYGRGIDRVVAISRAVQKSLIDSGFNSEDVDLVPSGIVPPERVDGARESVFAEFELGPEAKLVACVANLVGIKGHQTLIEATRQLRDRWPGLRILLAGDGPLRRQLEDLSRTAGVEDQVLFAGFRTDISRLLSASHMAVCPSFTEGLGLSILDALAMELPVAASHTGGIPEIIDHGESGLLVPPGEPGPLAEAMDRLLSDPDESARLGRRGRRTVLERFSVQAMVDGTEAVYRRLLGNGVPAPGEGGTASGD